jgi:hypothetical protein
VNVFGHTISMPQLYGQLLIGLINGSFYALLSLGLAVIFGMLTIVNFAHGAFYMMGAFAAYFLLQYTGLNYWFALILAPLIVGAIGAIVERLFLKRLAGFDPLYSLLLTFGLALIIQGLFQNFYGASGMPYAIPKQLTGAYNLGFMFLPVYRGWVILASAAVCFATWLIIEKTKLGAYLRAATENPTMVRAFGINVPRMVTLLWLRRRACGLRRRARRADQPGPSGHGRGHHRRRLRGRGDRRHGVDPRLDRDRLHARRRRGADESVLPGGVKHRGVRHHGDRPSDPPDWPVWAGGLTWRLRLPSPPRT